jgi:hypothetical protein
MRMKRTRALYEWQNRLRRHPLGTKQPPHVPAAPAPTLCHSTSNPPPPPPQVGARHGLNAFFSRHGPCTRPPPQPAAQRASKWRPTGPFTGARRRRRGAQQAGAGRIGGWTLVVGSGWAAGLGGRSPRSARPADWGASSRAEMALLVSAGPNRAQRTNTRSVPAAAETPGCIPAIPPPSAAAWWASKVE